MEEERFAETLDYDFVGLDRAPTQRELLSLQVGGEFARLAQHDARRVVPGGIEAEHPDLAGLRAVVTGAGSGIGAA